MRPPSYADRFEEQDPLKGLPPELRQMMVELKRTYETWLRMQEDAHRQRALLKQLVWALRMQGLSMGRIARQMGVSRQMVSHLVREMSEAQKLGRKLGRR